MKTIISFMAAFAVLISFSGCKKNEELRPSAPLADNDITLNAINNTNRVITIAGLANSPGFLNGNAADARFNTPMGIQVLKDGTLYVADRNNNAIRKISPAGIVSTETLKPAEGEADIVKPMYVGENDRKYLYIVCATDGDAYSHSFILNAGREVISETSVPYSVQSCLAKDPYQDVFWSSSGYSVGKYVIEGDPINGHESFDASDFFPPFSERGSSFKGLFVGRNKVIYFSNGSAMFKHTPSGVIARINQGLPVGSITSIVLNADSKTMYLAAGGYIEKIVNGKLTVMAGPNTQNPDGRDGLGFKADVNAFSLALGDHENVLYFSDTKTHTIRKLMLK